MSDEFWLRTNDASALLKAAEVALVRMGLQVRASSATNVSASWPDADPSVEKWGGNVQLAVTEKDVLLTLNGVGRPADFANSLVTAMGLPVTAEEA